MYLETEIELSLDSKNAEYLTLKSCMILLFTDGNTMKRYATFCSIC